MKKTLFVSSILVFVLALSACNGGASVSKVVQSAIQGLEAATTTATPDDPTRLSGLELAVGTLKLADGDQAISAEQAAKLLPLWQVIKDNQEKMQQARPQGTPDGTPQSKPQQKTETSGTPAAPGGEREPRSDEFQAIRDAMSEEQLQAIKDMNLTYDTMVTYLKEQGVEMPQMQGGPDGNQPDKTPPADGQRPTRDPNQTLTPRPTPSGEQQGQGSGGSRPEGMNPGGEHGSGPANGTSPANVTPGAQGMSGPGGGPRGGRGGFVPSAVVDAVIKYLEGLSSGV
ncbi:MAG: hypothetical protein LWX83_10225 [Anaerolineae bacterium]|nr:hypothetical protein [Anaerolineae bacterium]